MSDAPIHDEPAERAVLGAIVVRNEAFDEISDLLEPEHFGREHHRLAFEAIRRLHVAGKAFDYITLRDEVQRMGVADAVPMPFISQLGDGVPRTTNVRYYAGVVKDRWLRREIRNRARQLATDAERGEMTGVELLEHAEASMHGLSATAVKSDWVSGSELANELYPVLEQMHADRQDVSGLATGFTELDADTRGMQPGDLVLLGARPSMGKTAFALQVALHAAQSAPVAFFSLEMARVPIGLRGVIATAQVDGWKLLHGRLSELDQRRASDGLTRIGESHFYIDEAPMLSPVQARSKLRRLKSRVGKIGLVAIDYLQLMAPMPDDRRENKTNQVSGISRALKLLAREFSTPFLVLSQLNRGLERSGDKRPTMADLRDSGALEQDADVVLMLHRPEVYDPEKPDLRGLAEVIIAKQRNGPIGTVNLTWRAEQMRFENRAYR